MEQTFGEQIREILKRKNMMIGGLAGLLGQQSGLPVSVMALSAKLDKELCNEQEMRAIAQALGCEIRILVKEPEGIGRQEVDLTEFLEDSLFDVAEEEPVRKEPESVLEALGIDDLDLDDLDEETETLAEVLPEEPKEMSTEDMALDLERTLRETLARDFYADQETLEREKVNADWMEDAARKWEEELAKASQEEAEQELPDHSFKEDKDFVFPDPESFVPRFGEEDMRELDEVSAVSGPYVLKRSGEAPSEEEEPLDLDAIEESEAHPLHTNDDGGAVSEPYVIRREGPGPEMEADEHRWGDDSVPREFYENFTGEKEVLLSDPDSARNVQPRITVVPSISEDEVDDTLASWDAVGLAQIEKGFAGIEEEVLEEERKRALEEQKRAEEARRVEELRRIAMINPATGREFETNSVLHHPTKPDTLLVYDRESHGWTEHDERKFLNFQIQKRKTLGADYEPPIYLD